MENENWIDECVKCRAKSLATHEWIYGIPIPCKSGGVYMIDINADPDFCNSRFTYPSGSVIPVKETTIEKYIRLKDRNNREVYMGDILRHERSKEIFVVQHRERSYPCKNLDYISIVLHAINWDDDYYPERHITMNEDMVVIGNIIDNPELAETEADRMMKNAHSPNIWKAE